MYIHFNVGNAKVLRYGDKTNCSGGTRINNILHTSINALRQCRETERWAVMTADAKLIGELGG